MRSRRRLRPGGSLRRGDDLLRDEAGRIDVEADWADDLYLSMRHDGSDRATVDTNGGAEAVERLDLMRAYLGPADVQAGWGGCLLSAAGTVASVVAVQFWWSIAGAYATACSCVPLLDEEFEEIECPWY